jgi:hypothetical protein
MLYWKGRLRATKGRAKLPGALTLAAWTHIFRADELLLIDLSGFQQEVCTGAVAHPSGDQVLPEREARPGNNLSA